MDAEYYRDMLEDNLLNEVTYCVIIEALNDYSSDVRGNVGTTDKQIMSAWDIGRKDNECKGWFQLAIEKRLLAINKDSIDAQVEDFERKQKENEKQALDEMNQSIRDDNEEY